MEGTTCLVLSGGVALGAYQAGAYAALHERRELWPRYIAASSVGAVNGAIVAGTSPSARLEALQAFWRRSRSDLWWPGAVWVRTAPASVRHAYRWLLALQTRLLGCPGVMRRRPFQALFGGTLALYDLAPLRARLTSLIDFERLNHGEIRLRVVTTDLETGEPVAFDTARGDLIGPDHLVASCGFVPEFPPVEIGGRLLGDGGLAANAPIEAVLRDEVLRDRDILCFLIELFAPAGGRPATLAQAASRSLDLLFANQTVRTLRALEPADGDSRSVRVVPVRYHILPEEPGPHRLFDFSTVAITERWAAGYGDMARAITTDAGL